MNEPELFLSENPVNVAIRDWLKAHGYVPNDAFSWAICWSARSGLERMSLGFWQWNNDKYPTRWDAYMSCHASGTNPRLAIGTCESVEDVARTHEAIRLINGYKQPDGDRGPRDPTQE